MIGQNNPSDSSAIEKDIPTITVAKKEEKNPNILSRRPAKAFSHTKIEWWPRFPGCESIADKKAKKYCADRKLAQYFIDNMNYPATTEPVEGMIVVSLLVSVDGSISNPQILRGYNQAFDNEAMRVLNKMIDEKTKWVPAQFRGVPSAIEHKFPIRFKL